MTNVELAQAITTALGTELRHLDKPVYAEVLQVADKCIRTIRAEALNRPILPSSVPARAGHPGRGDTPPATLGNLPAADAASVAAGLSSPSAPQADAAPAANPPILPRRGRVTWLSPCGG